MKKRSRSRPPRMVLVDLRPARELAAKVDQLSDLVLQLAQVAAELQAERRQRSDRARRANETRRAQRTDPDTTIVYEPVEDSQL